MTTSTSDSTPDAAGSADATGSSSDTSTGDSSSNKYDSNLLLLGISYPSVTNQMKIHKFNEDVLSIKHECVDQAVECVRRGILTEMDARDYARCIATEQICDSNVYTVSMEIGGQYKQDRHLHGNFNSRNFVKNLRKHIGPDLKFKQIVLDYYWMPTGWFNGNEELVVKINGANTPQSVEVVVSDMSGKVISSVTNVSSNEVRIPSNYAQGMYLVMVRDEANGDVHNIKVMK